MCTNKLFTNHEYEHVLVYAEISIFYLQIHAFYMHRSESRASRNPQCHLYAVINMHYMMQMVVYARYNARAY